MMENSNTISHKPLRARKTMTPSSRKQMEMLSKIKNISAQEKVLNGLCTEDHHVQLNTVDIDCRSDDPVKGSSMTESNTDLFPEQSEMLPQKVTASIERFSVNSKENEDVKQCSYEKIFDQNNYQEESKEPPHEKSYNKNSDAKQFLNAGCLQDILHKWYENELNTPSSKPVEVHLYSKPDSLPVDQLPVDQLEESPCSEVPVNIDYGDEGRTNKMIPVLEKIDPTIEKNSAIEEIIPTLKKVDTIPDSNDVKHKYNLTHSVASTLPGTDRLGDGLESKTSHGNGSPNTVQDVAADAMLQETSPEYSIDNAQRKRVCSEGNEDIHCKRIKTSDENKKNICTMSEKEEHFWGKVKDLIEKQVDILNNDIFNHKLESLNGRVEQTQCRKKHEEIAITFLKKVSKLERRINTVIAFQKKILSKMVTSKANLPGANSQNAILNRTKTAPSLLDNINGRSVSSIKPVSSFPRQTGSTSESVAEENVSSDEVILISVESRNSTTANDSDVQKKLVSTQAEISTNAQSKTKHTEEKTKSAVIDLTEEEKHNFDKGNVKEDQTSTLNKTHSKSRAPKSNHFELPAQASNQVLEQFLYLPPLPQIPPYPELRDGFKDTVPPQKPELKLALVQNPKGIALSWTVTEIDRKCAPVESYHLFLYHEHNNNSAASHWKKIGVIKALPLPMACSLSQFTASKKYYFTIQSKDVSGRYGPFSDIQSITLIPLEY
uniref:Activating transcription factor 7 interacting protein 2 n=1 Tax=Pelusios castaneus TaxID=367368 RepID=A0A8C8R7I2_9SAUR